MAIRISCVILIIAGLVAGCSNEIESPTGVSLLPSQPEIPRGLNAAIGDGQVVLSWSVGQPAAVSAYIVYFSDSAAGNMAVLDSTTSTIDTISGLVNGQRYYFRVAAVDKSGIEGEKSNAVSVAPGIFSLIIEGGREYTRDRSVTLGLTTPPGTGYMQISEDSTFAEAHWESFSADIGFELTDGDGAKIVYARFQLYTGSSSFMTVSDDIILDRVAVIDTVIVREGDGTAFRADSVYRPGNRLHFMIRGLEKGQSAAVEVSGLGTIDLTDFGVEGDVTADDGVFEVDYIIPDETELAEAEIVGRFADAAGNEAPVKSAGVRLSVTSPPQPIDLWGYGVSSLELQLLWTKTTATDFSRYRVFRAKSDTSEANSTLIIDIVKADDIKFLDGGLDAETEYCYWIYTDDTHGNSARSERLCLTTLKNEPPETLVVAANYTGESLTAKLSWAKASTAYDFQSYRILRSRTDFADYDSSLAIEFLTDKTLTTYTDRSLSDTGIYYYRVYVYDRQGASSGSNLASVTIPE
jgi:fibronectin type 3 domain-containing protein